MPRVGDRWKEKSKSRDSFLPLVTSTPHPLAERQKRAVPSPSSSEQPEQAFKYRRTVSPIPSISSQVNGSARNSEDRRSEESAVTERPESTTPSDGSVVYKKAAGWIRKIELKDFLIHANYSLEFGPSVNFVTGPNGSGKSAIASGIAIGLGGRAAFTDRKGLLSDFIRKGKASALIRITLSNEGRDAFHPGRWGTSIVVERRIHKHGNRGRDAYRIYNENGERIGDSLGKLKQVLHRMNIQIDNPVFFLNQKKSKEFMQTVKPKEMYQFFYQATGFDTVEVVNECSHKSVEETDKELGRLHREAAIVEEELTEKKRRRDYAVDEAALFEKIEEARRNRLYYEHKKSKDELDELEVVVAEIRDRLDEIDVDLQEKENATQEEERTQHSVKESKLMEKYQKEYEKKSKDINDAKEKLKNVTKNMTNLKRKAKALSPATKAAKGRVRVSMTPGRLPTPVPAEQSAAQWAKSLSPNANRTLNHSAVNRTLNQSTVYRSPSNRQALGRSIRQTDVKQDHIDQRLGTLEKRQKELMEFLDNAGNLDEEYQKKVKEIEKLKKDGARTWKGCVSLETRRAAEYLTQLQDEGKGCTIMGPVADEVSLRLDTFAIAADQVLSPWLDTVILWMMADTTLHQRLAILNGIKDACTSDGYIHPPFLIVTNDVLEAQTVNVDREAVRKIAPDAKFMVDVVKVGKNKSMKTVLRNILPVRNAVFVEDSALAQELSLSDIVGLDQVYDAAGFCYGVENDTWSVTAPEVRTVVPQTSNGFTQMLTAAESEKIELAGKKQMVHDKTEELLRIKEQIVELTNRMEATMRQNMSTRQELNINTPARPTQPTGWDLNMSESIPSTSRGSPPRSSVAPRAAEEEDEGMGEEAVEQEEAPEEENDELTRLNETIQQGAESTKKMRADIKTWEKELKEVQKLYNTLQQAAPPASMRTRGAEKEKKEAIVKLKAEKETLNNKLKEQTKRIDACEENIKEAEQELAHLDVEDPDEMPVPSQSYEEVLDEVKKLDKEQCDLVMNKDVISRKQLKKEIEKLEQRKQDGIVDLDNATKLQTYMGENYKQRVVNKEVGLARAADQAQKHCTALMEEQGFKCQLNINIPGSTVDYRVAPASSKVLGPLNVLSGGERSMALAALLTAFWDQRSPFRVLDEFEVCMDANSREAAMKFLVQRAMYDSAQCIFFSPTNIDLDRIAKPGVIHRVELTAPQKGTQDEEPDSGSEN